jgi:hypothetical protein
MADECSDDDWIRERIARTKELIVKYEDAIESISNGAVQSYQLDTGQTRQFVTKAQLGSLQLTLTRLESRLATLQARLGCRQSIGRPGW